MAQKKMTIEQLAEMTQQEFLHIKNTMAAKQDLRDVGSEILSAIENLNGQITDMKQSLPSALDFARLEGRVDVIEKQLGISTTKS